ncbi:MAG: hypothetical protein K6E63_12610 [Lachnospiraceae bacterium]|nr:hypothetical protein [Lachnospiraceae bacterium]
MMIIIYGLLTLTGAGFLIVFNRLPYEKQLKLFRRIGNDRTIQDIKKTDPAGNAFKRSIDHCRKKIKIAVLILTTGSMLACIYELNMMETHELIDGNMIEREGYTGNSRKVRLKVHDGSGEEQDVIDVTVSKRKYDTDMLTDMAAKAEEQLMLEILGANDSLDNIRYDMSLPESLPDYPFSISWRIDDPLLLSSRGVINRDRYDENDIEAVNEGILTGIHAELKYEDYVCGIDLAARVFPVKTRELTFGEYLSELIFKADKETREDKELVLPGSLEGRKVIYEESSDLRSTAILFLAVAAAALMYYREDKELSDKVKKRDKELMRDYPELVNKFALFYSAGLPTRGIWHKLCRDYRESLEHGGKKKYLYEEMLLCEGRMNEGTGEVAAYETFASACGLFKYRQFISLICQAVGKGRADMILKLEDEACEAFTERKRHARELGEEAGTRLLFPMIMMLMVVLIIVTIPAFISFR